MNGKQLMIGLSLVLLLGASPSSALAADKTTKYRVYQHDALLMESSDYKKAEAYAKQFTNSHVEDIGTRKWLWNNYPRYKVYQGDYSSSDWEFATLDQAVREAGNWTRASVRDLQSGGWVWNNYPKYRVYQGDVTVSGWDFATLAQATAEAKKWSNAHVVDLSDQDWVWDNVTEAVKQQQRSSGVTYQVYQGSYTNANWKFGYLGDAVEESKKWGGSVVVNVDNNNKVVHSNAPIYDVYQYDSLLDSFIGLDDALAYAKQFSHSKIVDTSSPSRTGSIGIWSNFPTYQVYQSDKLIGDATTIEGAVGYASQYSNASVRLLDGAIKIWDNYRKLQIWGWNGSSGDSMIRSQVGNTTGLDVVSPTYFELADSSGGLSDKSNKDTVAWLKSQNYTVYPLVSNQFSSSLTTQFLSSAQAQTKFIQSLVNRAVAIGADGLNIDFESMNGKDRNAYTSFMRQLTDTAHQKGLNISIDLPRGSVKWNAQTAFDHEKLADIVDYIVTMTYDQYYKGSTEAGSVAGLQWVEEGIQEFLSYGIPRDKLIMGIPMYVREWAIDGSGSLLSNRALLVKDLPALISSKKAKLTWDSRFNQYKVEYSEDGNTNVFWLENEETIKARIEIAKKYDIGGVAIWRLGYDSSDIWKTMLQGK